MKKKNKQVLEFVCKHVYYADLTNKSITFQHLKKAVNLKQLYKQLQVSDVLLWAADLKATSTQSDFQAQQQQSEEATEERHRGPHQGASREWPETK